MKMKQLLALVLPKQIGVLGTALAVGSTAFSAFSSRKRDKRENAARLKQQSIERAVRSEQAVRERTRLQRVSRIAIANSEATALAGGGGVSSGRSIAKASAVSDLTVNLGNLNTAISGKESILTAQQNVLNAGQPSGLEAINQAFSPLLLNNVAPVNKFGSDIADFFIGE